VVLEKLVEEGEGSHHQDGGKSPDKQGQKGKKRSSHAIADCGDGLGAGRSGQNAGQRQQLHQLFFAQILLLAHQVIEKYTKMGFRSSIGTE